jgi:hypothetical protein
MKRAFWLFLFSLFTLGCAVQTVPPAHVAEAPALSQQLVIVSSFNPMSAPEKKYVDGHVSAFMNRINWAQIEVTQGKYNFSTLDSMDSQWILQGKKVALIVSPASDQGVNTATPAYVLSQTPKTAPCNAFPSPCPITDTAFFEARYEAFIQALLAHLAPISNSVFYVRFGTTGGGESCPHCYLAHPWPGGEAAFMAYLQNLATFVKNLHSPVQVVFDMNGCINNQWADQMGDIAAGAGLGIGMDSVRASDVTAYSSGKQCSSDWCKKFQQYPAVFHYLQSYDPDTIPDVLTYLPFVREQQFNVRALELPEKYLDAAYNPANPSYAQYHVALQKALQLP